MINAPIVSVIIGEMLWDPKDIEGKTHTNMMAWFIDVGGDLEALQGGQGRDRYRVVIKNQLQWSLSIDCLYVGLSFCQASRALQHTKECSGMASIGACSDSTISKYARIAFAINLQKVYDLLEETRTFLVALYMSTHMITSYLDIRICLHLNRPGIVNVHLLAAPVYERHTAAVIFDTVAKALDVLCPSWKDIIGVLTDGERKMTGRISGVANRFQNLAKSGFICIWCSTHKLDIMLQSAHSKLGDKAFYTQLTTLISYLWRQQNFVSAIRSKAPKVADTRWESMGNVSDYFKKHKTQIGMHINDKRPSSTPSHVWWIHLLVVAKFYRSATTTFKCLQGHHVTVSMQRTHLLTMQTSLLHAVGRRSPMSGLEATDLDDSEWVLS